MKTKTYRIKITEQAAQDIRRLGAEIKRKLKTILEDVIAQRPYEGKKLVSELAGRYSYSFSFHEKIVYSIDVEKEVVYVEKISIATP